MCTVHISCRNNEIILQSVICFLRLWRLRLINNTYFAVDGHRMKTQGVFSVSGMYNLWYIQ